MLIAYSHSEVNSTKLFLSEFSASLIRVFDSGLIEPDISDGCSCSKGDEDDEGREIREAPREAVLKCLFFAVTSQRS